MSNNEIRGSNERIKDNEERQRFRGITTGNPEAIHIDSNYRKIFQNYEPFHKNDVHIFPSLFQIENISEKDTPWIIEGEFRNGLRQVSHEHLVRRLVDKNSNQRHKNYLECSLEFVSHCDCRKED